MRMHLVLLLTFCVVVFAQLPAYIKRCSVKDPNINTCALSSARQAIPHLVKGDRKIKFPVMDPLFVTELRVVNQGLDTSMENSTVTGLKDIYLESLSFDFDKKEVTFEGVLQYLNLTGNYTVAGKVATLPISGKGPYTASFLNLTITYKTHYDLMKLDDGEVYMIFQDYDTNIIPQSVTVHLDNLFNGNKLLGDTMNSFLNENWRAIYKELGKSTSQAVGGIMLRIFKESAKTVPFKDIFDDVELTE